MSDQYQITETEHLWIPLPDGRRLAARMWLPEGTGPFPAILEYLPYRKRDGTAPRDATTHPVFAAQGYACVRVDIAGSGDSDGRFDDEYSEQELSDGEAVLDWIASQHWSSGKVGMIGISWGGFNGLQMAYRRPEALKAVVSVASTVDRYADDIHYMGGCLLSDNTNWASQMFAYMTRPLDPVLRPDWRSEWLGRIEDLPFMAADWLRHPTRDGFWKHGSICEDWSAITAPVLAITGWADAYVNAPPAIAAKMTGAPAKALMGPWEHRYAHISQIEAADFHGEVLRWFDQYLKGEQAGADSLPDYRVFMQEFTPPSPKNVPQNGRWVAEEVWPSPSVSEVVWPLAEEGFAPDPQAGTARVKSPATVGQAGAISAPASASTTNVRAIRRWTMRHRLALTARPCWRRWSCWAAPVCGCPSALIGRWRRWWRGSATWRPRGNRSGSPIVPATCVTMTVTRSQRDWSRASATR